MTEKYERLIIIRTDGEHVYKFAQSANLGSSAESELLNIPVSRIERDDCIVCAYRGDELVGIIDL